MPLLASCGTGGAGPLLGASGVQHRRGGCAAERAGGPSVDRRCGAAQRLPFCRAIRARRSSLQCCAHPRPEQQRKQHIRTLVWRWLRTTCTFLAAPHTLLRVRCHVRAQRGKPSSSSSSSRRPSANPSAPLPPLPKPAAAARLRLPRATLGGASCCRTAAWSSPRSCSRTRPARSRPCSASGAALRLRRPQRASSGVALAEREQAFHLVRC